MWYPIRLSRITSFHHKKAINTNKNNGNKTLNRDNFKLTHKTVLPITENRIKETKIGQKEVWTAKKGLVNTIMF